jgi:hypothetical protein
MSLRLGSRTTSITRVGNEIVSQQSTAGKKLWFVLFAVSAIAAFRYAWHDTTGTVPRHDASSKTNPLSNVIEPEEHAKLIRYNASCGHKPITLWSSDFHISPIADIKHLLSDTGVNFIDKSLSGHCHLTSSCESDLRVITKLNGLNLRPCANDLRRSFYNSYRTDPMMLGVDAFLCTHAASLCEVFMPFNKPMIVIASTRYSTNTNANAACCVDLYKPALPSATYILYTTLFTVMIRYEIGRLDAESWKRWNSNLRQIAANPLNTIAANNKYDQVWSGMDMDMDMDMGILGFLLAAFLCYAASL